MVRPLQGDRPALEDIATSGGKVTVAKMNIDENPKTPEQVRRARHPHADAVQERPGRRDQDRRPAQGRAVPVGRIGHLSDRAPRPQALPSGGGFCIQLLRASTAPAR